MVGSCLRFMEMNVCRDTSTHINMKNAGRKSLATPFQPHARPLHRHRTLATADREVQAGQTLTRRQVQAEALLLALIGAGLQAGPAQAVGFKKELKKKKIPIEEYSELPDGLKYYDLNPGSGKVVAAGTEVTVHFDCMYRGIDVVSSRAARLLGGNRTIAEPFQFIAGESVSQKKVKMGDSAGGLFTGSGGPKAPPALSTAVIGMKVGGVRSVIVPPELGYGDVGEQEIGPGQTFELKIEVLSVA